MLLQYVVLSELLDTKGRTYMYLVPAQTDDCTVCLL